jgi:hypothetical protein
MPYAWIITHDHLEPVGSEYSEVGTAGPYRAPESMLRQLAEGEGYVFTMYDDDGILYYTGRLVTDEPGSEESSYGPLGDFGLPNAGAVEIRYAGRREWDCG